MYLDTGTDNCQLELQEIVPSLCHSYFDRGSSVIVHSSLSPRPIKSQSIIGPVLVLIGVCWIQNEDKSLCCILLNFLASSDASLK